MNDCGRGGGVARLVIGEPAESSIVVRTEYSVKVRWSEADPAGRVHRPVIEVMHELGIDLAGRRPQRLTRELAESADVVVTMGCGDACPYIPGKRYVDWELADPKGQPVEAMYIILSGHAAHMLDQAGAWRKAIDWYAGDATGMLPYSRRAWPMPHISTH